MESIIKYFHELSFNLQNSYKLYFSVLGLGFSQFVKKFEGGLEKQ